MSPPAHQVILTQRRSVLCNAITKKQFHTWRAAHRTASILDVSKGSSTAMPPQSAIALLHSSSKLITLHHHQQHRGDWYRANIAKLVFVIGEPIFDECPAVMKEKVLSNLT